MRNPSRIKLLVFDETEMYRAGLYSILAGDDRFQEISQVATQRECLEVLAHAHPEVVIIVMNDSPAMVSELVRIFRRMVPMPSILIIGDSGEHRFEAFTWKVNGYLPRSASKAMFMKTIDTVYEGNFVFEPPMDAVINYENEVARRFELSERELDVFRLIALGKKDKEIASILGLSQHTIRNHVRHVLYKLGCTRKSDVVRRGFNDYVLTVM
ncbi:response regulator transcription factor [Alicyclobacillus sp. SO9]|uniref:response regulator transcription factor n=1 Tax=Alicyclobacillus sp. SO9 TaxID=2665646 RepID=UPI0018E7B67E|nr:response regulator transcription factor [Alicyclobacillus sp. SO9]QQE78430.1 response regulator transcription factor [Alicyclobacillus sp. SO9]